MTRASDAQRLLEQARGHLEPESRDAARVRQLLAEQLSNESGIRRSDPQGTPLVGSSGSEQSGRTALPASPGVSHLLLVGLVTGVTGFLLGLAVERPLSIQRTEAPAPRAIEPAPFAVVPGVPPVTSLAAPRQLPAPEAARAPERARPTPPRPRATTPRRAPLAPSSVIATEPLAAKPSSASSAPERSAATEPLDLRAALGLLRRAEAERQAGRLEGALALLAELEERAPELLVEERLVTAVLCECDRGNTSRARELARAVADANPSSIYARRVRASCAANER